jgi:hypothetical protein
MLQAKDAGPKRRPAKRSAAKRKPARRPYKSNLRRGPYKATQTKAEFIREQIDKGRTNKQADATWTMLRKKQGYATTKKKQRTYGKGRYKALKARAGGKSKYTYLYRTKKSNVRHLPDHALLGYKSSAEMRKVYKTGTEKQRASLSGRLQKLQDRRVRASSKASERALKGKSWFSPNPGEVLSFEEWKMKKNRKKSTRKKKAAPRTKAAFVRSQMAQGRTRPQAEASWRMVTGAKKKAKKKTTKKRTVRRAATKRTAARKPRKAAKRKSTKRKTRKKVGFAKMTKAQRCKVARRGGRAAARKKYGPKGRKRAARKPCGPKRRMRANKRGSYAANRKKYSYKSYASNKRRGTKRKSYRRNASGAQFKLELRNAFKYGLIVTGGVIGHRVATFLLDKYGLSKIDALVTGKGAEYRKLISGAIAAAIMVPVVVRLTPKHAGVAAAGVAASFLHQLIVTGLQKLAPQQPMLAEAIGNYANAPGYAQYSGMGAYYEFSPHQVYSGYGEFYETVPTPGLEQAAAGMGFGATGQMLTQAAAGYGQLPHLQQMYANSMGEYYATGLEGIGEYEAAPDASVGTPAYTDDGIHPNLNSAEQMLDVAEAAAGVGGLGASGEMLTQAAAGFGGLPLQSTVNPMISAMNIPDVPGGSRAGILAGGDGIFG